MKYGSFMNLDHCVNCSIVTVYYCSVLVSKIVSLSVQIELKTNAVFLCKTYKLVLL